MPPVPAAPIALRNDATVVVSTHPDGFAHTQATIAKMAQLATAGSHTFALVALARSIVHDVPSRDYRGEMQALYLWVREHVRYRKDPVGLEWVQTPERTIRERAGDCDDMATLLAALVGSVGHEWRFVTVGPAPRVQGHIAVQAFDSRGKQWVTLDPVMEVQQPTTVLRTDLGAFGRQPPGATTRYWNQRGESMLGAYPSEQMKTLWSWQPYFPQFPGAALPSLPTANTAYRSAGAPGYASQGYPSMGPSQVMSGLGNTQPYGMPYDKRARAFAHDAVSRGMIKPSTLQGWERRGRLGDEPVLLYLTDNDVDRTRLDGLGGYPFALGSIWGSIKKIGKAVVGGVKKVASTAGKVVKAVVKSPIGKIAMPAVALNVDPRLKALRNAVVGKLPGGSALLKVGTAGEKLLAKATKLTPKKPAVVKPPAHVAPHVAPHPALVRRPAAPSIARKLVVSPRVVIAPKAAAVRPSDWKKPHPELRRRYPGNAQQTYDASAQVFRVYAPRGSAAGRMSGLIPTMTFTVGALGALGAVQSGQADGLVNYVSRMRASAKAAADAVANFIKSRADHRAPGKSVPAVLAFQRDDAARAKFGFGGTPLKQDGLWGSNTRAAASYYLGTPQAQLPEFLPALNAAATWSPPTAVSPVSAAAAPAAAPAPVLAVRPATPAPAASSGGMVEVGQEQLNPGLPPIGAPPIAGSAVGPASPVFTPSPAALPSLPVTSSPVPAIPMLPPPIIPSAAAPVLSPLDDLPVVPQPAQRPPAGSVLNLPPPAPSSSYAQQGGAPLPFPTLPAPPMAAGPGYSAGPTLPSEAGGGAMCDSGGSILPWLAAAYYVSTRRRSA